MAFNIVYKKSVSRDLKGLSKAEIKRVLDQIESVLPKKADKQPVLKGGFAGLRKFRAGDYRVVYALVEQDAVILRVRHRKDVYRT